MYQITTKLYNKGILILEQTVSYDENHKEEPQKDVRSLLEEFVSLN